MADPLLKYTPVFLVQCLFTSTHYFSTKSGRYLAGGSTNFYKGTLSPFSVKEHLYDLYYGVEPSESITLTFANYDNVLDSTWHDIINGEEIRGSWVAIYSYDDVDGATFLYRGKIVDWDVREEVKLTVEMRDDTTLDTLIPGTVTTATFACAPDRDVNKAINICFGHCRNVPLRLIKNDTTSDIYDYLIGYGVIEGLWENASTGNGVRRNGVLVNTSEYVFYDGSQSTNSGFAFLRFSAEQRDFGGEFYDLTADVYGLEISGASAERNFATIIGALITNTVWGLSDAIDTTLFATAASDLDAMGTDMYCDGAVTQKTYARDVIDELLFMSRGFLWRGSDGEWEIDCDTGYISSTDDYFGFRDHQYGGILKIEKRYVTKSSEAFKTLTAYYALEENWDDDKPSEKKKELTVSTDFGQDKEYKLNFVRENDTADAFLSYLCNRQKYGGEFLTLSVDMRGRDRVRGDIIYVNIPDYGIAGKYRIGSVTRTMEGSVLDCYTYDSQIYDIETIPDPPGPDADDIVIDGPKTFVGPISLGDGDTQPGSISFKVAPGKGDTFIAAGKTDFDNTEAGFILGVDDSDSDLSKFYVGNSTHYLNWTGSNLVVQAGGISFDGVNNWIKSGNYVSGPAGAGFLISPEFLEFGNLYIRGVIRSAVFQVGSITAIGGDFIVRPGDGLKHDIAESAASTVTMYVEGDASYSTNDVLEMKGGVDDEYFRVDSVSASGSTLIVTRDYAGYYGTAPYWGAGACVVNHGQSGEGAVFLSSTDPQGPYMSLFTHEGSPWNKTTRLRVGNLDGYLGYSSSLFGIAVGTTEQHMKYDPTNGMRVSGQLEVRGTSRLYGALEIDSTGYLRSKIGGSYPYLEFSNEGLQLRTSDLGGTYGTAKYDTDKFGYGALVWMLNDSLKIPWAELKEPTNDSSQTLASMRLYNRASDPDGPAEVGDLAVVSGKLKMCTSGGTPGTWTVVGTQT